MMQCTNHIKAIQIEELKKVANMSALIARQTRIKHLATVNPLIRPDALKGLLRAFPCSLEPSPY